MDMTRNMSIAQRDMCKAFEEVHEALSSGVRKTGVYVMHFHLSVSIHFSQTRLPYNKLQHI